MVQKLEEDGRMSERQMTWRIGGMHCPKCESAVVKAVSALPGIREAQSDWRRGTLTALWDSDVTSKDALVASVAEAGYALETQSGNRIFRTVAVLLAAALLFVILELTPLRAMLSAFPTARAGMGFATLFALGLTTSLHCVGMCGGINLVQSAGEAQAGRKVGLSNLQYNLGRVLSYTVIGGIVGTLGSVIRLSTAVQAGIQIVAAVLMGLMALKLLDAGGLSLAMSGKLRSRLMGKGKRSSLWIGLVNGLMPCGPLQAMQLYALSTGSWWMGALSMLMFSLGTVPLMLGFGLISGRLNRCFAKPMRIISGALVMVMAVAMLTNGLALAGVGLRVGGIGSSDHAEIAPEIQIVNSELDYRSYPDITVQAGIPVRWTIHAEADRITGCNNEMVIPALNLRVPLSEGDNVVEFTVDTPGVIDYTCWMGMLHGSITVQE